MINLQDSFRTNGQGELRMATLSSKLPQQINPEDYCCKSTLQKQNQHGILIWSMKPVN